MSETGFAPALPKVFTQCVELEIPARETLKQWQDSLSDSDLSDLATQALAHALISRMPEAMKACFHVIEKSHNSISVVDAGGKELFTVRALAGTSVSLHRCKLHNKEHHCAGTE